MADPLGPPDFKVVGLLPDGLIEATDQFSVSNVLRLETLIFCCYFRNDTRRDQFLADLKSLAAKTLSEPTSIRLSGFEPRKLLLGTVSEICGHLRQTYHSYKLKAEFAPYYSSALIAFTELDPTATRLAVLRSLQELESDKMRIMGMAGIEVENEIE